MLAATIRDGAPGLDLTAEIQAAVTHNKVAQFGAVSKLADYKN